MDFTDAGMSNDLPGLPSGTFGGLSDVSQGDAGSPGPAPYQHLLQINGRLLPPLIARVLFDHHAGLASCGARLRASPGDLVSIKFVIDRQGQVKSSSDGGSKTANAALVSCCERLIMGLTFPAPDGGEVTVVDPMVF
jgi:hypothetical protein